MHFALRKNGFIYMECATVCLRAKPPGYHMATAVIIWMLWCTSTVRVPRECSLSLNTLSRWHLKHTEWIWMLDCALHLQIVGVAARKLSGDCNTNHSPCLNQGTNVGKEGNDRNKITCLCLSTLHCCTCMTPSCLLSVYSRYCGADEACHSHKSHWSCTLMMYCM